MRKNSVYLFFLLIVNAITFSKSEKFTFSVLGNPQAFRLPNNEGDPNNENLNGLKWEKINRNVVEALHSIPDISFAIVNGDLTEFGKKKSWEKVLEMYNSSEFFFFFGLGDHDYEQNIGRCYRRTFLSKNGCAIESILQMKKLLTFYKKKHVLNFRKDLISSMGSFNGFLSGSLSYSWDSKNVHFVQLQNHPVYYVNLTSNALKLKNYSIKKSLTWLADDLRSARFRNVSDIIINFHDSKKFQERAIPHDKTYFKTIITTYKPLAIFTGFPDNDTVKELKDPTFFGDAKVCHTGAAFDGDLLVVKYDNGNLIVEKGNAKNGTLQISKEYKIEPKTKIPLCIEEGTNVTAPKDLIFATAFIHSIETKWWHLLHTKGSQKILGTNEQGDVYLTEYDPVNENLWWSFKPDSQFKRPQFLERYWIQNKETKLVLTSDNTGKVFTENKSLVSTKQQWRILKGQGSKMMLINLGTARFLHATKSGNVSAEPGYNIENENKAWEATDPSSRDAIQNVRYFQALKKESLKKPFPVGDNSDDSWKYLGSHDYLQPSPCIGW